MTVYEFGCIYEDCVSSGNVNEDILLYIVREENLPLSEVEWLYEQYINSDVRKQIPDYYFGA